MASDSRQSFDYATADFNAVYRGGALLEDSGITIVPWDVGEVQPGVIEFEDRGRFVGEVLDAGCGLGDNAIYLASRGHTVVAIDAASAAIEQAQVRAAGAGPIEFVVADLTVLDGYAGRFDSVLDSALFHTLDDAGRRRYASALHRATKPGALLNMLAFANVEGGMPAPLSVSEQDVRSILAEAGWQVTEVGTTVFWGVAASTKAFFDKVGLAVEIDDRGHTRLPVWSVQAVRES